MDKENVRTAARLAAYAVARRAGALSVEDAQVVPRDSTKTQQGIMKAE